MSKEKTRLFPPVLIAAAFVFINIVTRYRKGFPLLSSLGSLAFTMTLFLVLITVVDCLNRSDFWEKCKRFFIQAGLKLKKVSLKKNNAGEESDAGGQREIFGQQETGGQYCERQEACEQPGGSQGDLPQTGDLAQDDLHAIKKETVSQPRQAGVRLEERVYAALYIAAFLGIAVWRVIGILRVKPWAYVVQNTGSIVDAVLLLILPCVSVFYVKMRDEDASPTGAFSRDILMLFSYTSFVYAAVVAASSVLKLNLLIILPWVYYAVSLYLIASLAVNIALSMLKGSILGFGYTLFMKISRSKDKTAEFEDFPETTWKVSIKSLYTIRYCLSILPALALALLFILFVSTAIFVVQPHQQAAVYRFGKLTASSVKNEGIHLKFPWPIDKAEIYDVHRVSSMQIGYESSKSGNFLWGQAHDGGEYMLLLGNGNEMAAVNLKILYLISDLYAYIKTCTNPQAVLSAAAYNALMSRTINTTLDSFLNVDRNSLSESVLTELSRFCESENLGLSVKQIIVESIHPPVDIAEVYQNVVSASVDKTTTITRAQSYAQAKVIEAARLSKTAIDGARAMQYSRTSDAQKEAAVFYAASEAYRIAGGSFALVKQLEVYEKIIKSNKVYVFSPGVERNLSKFIIGRVNTLNLSAVQGEER